MVAHAFSPKLTGRRQTALGLPARRYNHSGVTALRFEGDWSGLVQLDKAECVVEVEVGLGHASRLSLLRGTRAAFGRVQPTVQPSCPLCCGANPSALQSLARP